jgi:cardiolipin synthase
MIIGAVMLSWLMGSPLKVKPLMVSKLNTAAQIVFACVLLASLGFHMPWSALITVLMVVVAVFTLASIAAYLVEWIRHMNAEAAKQ